MECALSWDAGNGGLDRPENSYTFLIILCLLNYPQVCFSFPCLLWESEAGLLGALGSMKGEFPRNLTDFRAEHTHFRTQLLSLLLFVCFSSSKPCLSLACFSIFSSSSSSSESSVDTTQCWSQLLEQGIVPACGYQEELFSCLSCGYQNSLHFYFFKVCYSVSRGSAGASSLSALSWWAPVGVDEGQKVFFPNVPFPP